MSESSPNLRASTKFFLSKKQNMFFQRRRVCPLSSPDAPKVDYKDCDLLSKFVSEGGRILPARVTAVSRKKQRLLRTAIKRARNLALLPFASNNH